MKIIIPLEGQVRTVICSSFVAAKRLTENTYSLTGEVFQMTGVTPEQVLILPDGVSVQEGQQVTDELLMQALPIESFIAVSAEEALPNALGMLLRLAIADGRLTDAELLSIQPVLEGRLWQPGLAVQVGDVYTFGACLWRCLQAHTTQSEWPPDLVPSLWRKVEVIPEDAVRVWAAGIDYVVGDVLAYPDKDSPQYECLTGHISQAGWEPPNAPSLWRLHQTDNEESGNALELEYDMGSHQ